MDRGDTWTAGPDLTKQISRDTLSIMGAPGDKPMISKNDGTANYGNITTVAESPVLPGVIWAGTDDGNVQMSKDGGATWTDVSGNFKDIPKTHQVSRVDQQQRPDDPALMRLPTRRPNRTHPLRPHPAWRMRRRQR